MRWFIYWFSRVLKNEKKQQQIRKMIMIDVFNMQQQLRLIMKKFEKPLNNN